MAVRSHWRRARRTTAALGDDAGFVTVNGHLVIPDGLVEVGKHNVHAAAERHSTVRVRAIGRVRCLGERVERRGEVAPDQRIACILEPRAAFGPLPPLLQREEELAAVFEP